TDADIGEELRVLVTRVALEIDMAVEHEKAAVLQLPERVDLGEREIVAEEDLDERRDDRREAVEIVAPHARRRDRLLRLVGREGDQRRDVRARDVVGMRLRDLLDVDPAHVAEDDDGELLPAVPRDRREVLLRDGRALLDEDAARLLALDA